MRKVNILLIVILLIRSLSIAQCPIIPTPTEYREHQGIYILGDVFLINDQNVPHDVKDYLIQQLTKFHKVNSSLNLDSGDLFFERINSEIKDFYKVEIHDSIRIEYTSDASCFYAVNSMLQLLRKENDHVYFTKVSLTDYPRFDWRGMHLDVSRHFFTVDEVKRFIDLMALYKYNKFHWHLTDDQGWRIEIKKYPLLTTIGSIRDSTLLGHYSDIPRVYDKQKQEGFYSQEEIVEIVDYANSKYIEVIPEIEMPGHSRAALAAYPELSCIGNELPVPGIWGVFDDIYCTKSETIDFLKCVLDEVMVLFPSKYIHIGGDEAPKLRWKNCSNCKEVMDRNNLQNEHELQSYFIRKIDSYLAESGKQLIGWDEILEGGLSENAVVMSWRGEEGGVEAAKQGHKVIMSPTSHCYFDYYQSAHKMEPLAIGGYLPLEKVYNFNPVPNELTKNEINCILGGQANVWTEYITTIEKLEFMTYPRALALIQNLWCINKPDYNSFLKNLLSFQESYLTLHNVNFSNSVHYPELQMFSSKNGVKIHFKGCDENYSFELYSKEFDALSMNSSFKTGPSDTLYLKRDNETRDIIYRLTSYRFPGFVEYKFRLHSAIGLPIELYTPPHSKYDHNGNLNLVDGIKGSKPWKGSEWLGFQVENIEFSVDLIKKKSVNSLELGFLEDNGSWIYLPSKVEIFISNNKRNWKSIGEQTVQSEQFIMGINKNIRYIKVIVHAMHVIPEGKAGGGFVPWTFIDELELH